jgi:hypothetical protein
MRLRDSYRVPFLLVACLVTALVLPRACAETRVGVGAVFPSTASLTAADSGDAAAAARAENARLLNEIARLEEELEARPYGAGGSLGDARVVRAATRRAPVAIAARVRQRDASATRCSFLVDVGRADGVREGLPVIWSGSLVGLVSAATDHAALVIRVDDPTTASSVPATFVGDESAAPRRGGAGLSRGQGAGELVVSLLRAGAARVGDVAVTGVGNPLIPEGLAIGEVVRFADDDRDGSFEASVPPLRDLDTLNSVLVLLVDVPGGPSFAVGARR